MQPSYQTKSTAQLNLCSRNPFKPHSKLKHSSNQLNHLHKSFFHSFFLIKLLTHCFTIKQATLHPILFLHVSFYPLYTSGKLLLEYPEIPWRKIVALRNIISHEYANIDEEIIFAIVKQSLPPLKLAVLEIINAFQS